MNNAPRGCAARREEVYAVHTPRAQRVGKQLFVFPTLTVPPLSHTIGTRQIKMSILLRMLLHS